MNLSFSVPNPLARLTGLLDALEQARAEAAAHAKERGNLLDRVDKPRAEVQTDREGDLESRSLSRCGESLEPRSHDLEAMSLILYIVVGKDVINMMPLSVLGAIVLYTGYKLCAPRVWKHIAHIGTEQLFVFTTTVLVTVSTDLLWGIAAGIVTKLVMEAIIQSNIVRGRSDGHEPPFLAARRWLVQSGELFRNPVVQRGAVGETYHLYFGRPLVCFNALHLESELDRIPRGVSSVALHVTDLVTLIDHTTAATLLDFVEDFKRTGRGIAEIIGLDRLRGHSHAASCLRVNSPVLATELVDARTALARMSLTLISQEIPDPVAYLERISLRHYGPIEGQDDHVVTAFLIRNAKQLAWGIDACLEIVRSVLDYDDAEDYQTVRDLALVSLHPIDLGRPSMDSIFRSLPGIPASAELSLAGASQPASRPSGEQRRYM
jgi:hypothetical protein